MTRPVLLTI